MKNYSALFCCLLLSIGAIVQATGEDQQDLQDKDNHGPSNARSLPEDQQQPEEASPNFPESGYRSQHGRSIKWLKEYCQKIRDLKNKGVPIILPPVCLLVPTIRPPTIKTTKYPTPRTTTSTSTSSTSSPTPPPLPTPCSISSNFTPSDFKAQDGNTNRFEASNFLIALNCHASSSFSKGCKCNVKNLVKMDELGNVFENFEDACTCSAECGPPSTGSSCAVGISIISDNANKPEADPPQPMLVRKFAMCICQEDSAVESSSFKCTCT